MESSKIRGKGVMGFAEAMLDEGTVAAQVVEYIRRIISRFTSHFTFKKHNVRVFQGIIDQKFSII